MGQRTQHSPVLVTVIDSQVSYSANFHFSSMLPKQILCVVNKVFETEIKYQLIWSWIWQQLDICSTCCTQNHEWWFLVFTSILMKWQIFIYFLMTHLSNFQSAKYWLLVVSWDIHIGGGNRNGGCCKFISWNLKRFI